MRVPVQCRRQPEPRMLLFFPRGLLPLRPEHHKGKEFNPQPGSENRLPLTQLCPGERPSGCSCCPSLGNGTVRPPSLHPSFLDINFKVWRLAFYDLKHRVYPTPLGLRFLRVGGSRLRQGQLLSTFPRAFPSPANITHSNCSAGMCAGRGQRAGPSPGS